MKTLHNTKHKNVNIVKGDIFHTIKMCANGGNYGCSVVVPHVCNNINLFGAGFAAAVAKNYPEVKENFHLLGNKAVLGHSQFVQVYRDKKFNHQIIFANMIAQNGVLSSSNARPLNYYALATCMANVDAYIKKHSDSETTIQIHAPKFGSGLAGGNWLFIQELISDIWKDYPVFVYSYNLSK